MTQVQMKIQGPSRPGDPLAGRFDDPDYSGAPPVAEWVDAEVIEELANGSLRLRVGAHPKAAKIVTAVEGEGVGEFRALGGVDHGRLRTIRQALAALLQDSDASVRTAAESVASLFGRGGRKGVVTQLLNVATNTKREGGMRVMALTLLGVILAQEIDR